MGLGFKGESLELRSLGSGVRVKGLGVQGLGIGV